eukprot:206536-Rhodomonas_salina.1
MHRARGGVPVHNNQHWAKCDVHWRCPLQSFVVVVHADDCIPQHHDSRHYGQDLLVVGCECQPVIGQGRTPSPKKKDVTRDAVIYQTVFPDDELRVLIGGWQPWDRESSRLSGSNL